jgi:hypothetical protein
VEQSADGLAGQDLEVLVWRDPVLDDQAALDLVDQTRQVLAVVESVTA